MPVQQKEFDLDVGYTDQPRNWMGEVVLFGRPGTGKTPVACQMPDALILDGGDGCRAIKGFIHPVYHPEDALKFLRVAVAEPERFGNKFQGIVLDEIGIMYRRFVELTESGKLRATDGTEANKDIRSIHKVAASWMREIINTLHEAPFPVIITAHPKDEATKWKGEGKWKEAIAWDVVIDLPRSAREELTRRCDTILYVSPDEANNRSMCYGKIVQVGTKRLIARDRHSRFQDPKPLSWHTLAYALGFDVSKPRET